MTAPPQDQLLLAPGFAEPALDAQRCFRALLEAMGRPGRVLRLGPLLAGPPAPLGVAAAAAMLALADADTPVWLDAAARPAAAWLRFHAGCPILPAPGDAAFALVARGEATPPLEALAQGSEEEPHASATLVLQVAALEEGGGGWRLTGPGIETLHRLRVEGLPPGFRARWAANHARFPRGVDVILCAGDRLAALPRTVRIEEGAPG
jgi:alpha-D-ribose 1-methylphosphonate 5-triphosphate synthase subunit PhnH